MGQRTGSPLITEIHERRQKLTGFSQIYWFYWKSPSPIIWAFTATREVLVCLGTLKSLKNNRFMNLDRFPVKQARNDWIQYKTRCSYDTTYDTTIIITKWHGMPHLPRNQAPLHGLHRRSSWSAVHHRQTPGHDCKNIQIMVLIKGTYEQGVKTAKFND